MGSHATAIANTQLPIPSLGMAPTPVAALRGEWMHALLEGLDHGNLAKVRRSQRLVDALLREPLCRIPLETVAAALDQSACLTGNPLIGLHLAQQWRPSGLLHSLMASQENLGAAIDQLVCFAGVVCSGTAIRFTGRGATRALILWPALAPSYPQVSAACLAMIAAELRDATNGRVRFEEVRLRSAPAGPAAHYEAIFGCPVRFAEADDALVLAALDLRIRMRRRNRDVAERLEEAARWELQTLAHPTARERVEAILRVMLHDGESCRRATVARRLVCSTRALRRALESEGTSFREIVAAVRREMALALVGHTDLSLATVAAHCGFAGLAAFSKAFRRWTVSAPSAFREMQNAAARQEHRGRGPATRISGAVRGRRDGASPTARPLARSMSR